MKIMITGVSGFLGSALFERLNQENIQLVGVGRKNAFDHKIKADYQYCNFLEYESICGLNLSGVDTIIHAAGAAHGKESKNIHQINYRGTEILAQAAQKSGVKNFIFISSVGVHGVSNCKVISEEDDCFPEDNYSRSKLAAESSLIKLTTLGAMKVLILRIPMVCAKNAPGNFFRLQRLINLGIPVPFGRIENKRSFLSLTNFLDFVETCLTYKRNESPQSDIFLISDSGYLSTKDLYIKIALASAKKPRILKIPTSLLKILMGVLGKNRMKESLFEDLVVDCSKAKKYYGWEPKYTIDRELGILS